MTAVYAFERHTDFRESSGPYASREELRADEEVAERRRERAALARERVAAPASSRAVKPCGTLAAYARHCRRGEEACTACKRVYYARQAEYRQRRKAAQGVAEHRGPLTLPVADPEVFEQAPCTRPEFDYAWDGQREHEERAQARERWQLAATLCLTVCPVIEPCRRLRDALGKPDGVWAGRIPDGRIRTTTTSEETQ